MDIKSLLNPAPRSKSNPEVHKHKEPTNRMNKRENMSEPNCNENNALNPLQESHENIQSPLTVQSPFEGYQPVVYPSQVRSSELYRPDYNIPVRIAPRVYPLEQVRAHPYSDTRRATIASPIFQPELRRDSSSLLDMKHRASVPTKPTMNAAPSYSRHQLKQKATPAQIEYLEAGFQTNRFPTQEEIEVIGEAIQMKGYSVKFWYQNRRQKRAMLLRNEAKEKTRDDHRH